MTIRRVQRGKNHSYTIDGKLVLGVTTALRSLSKDDIIARWAAKAVALHVATMPEQEFAFLRGMGPDTMADILKAVPWKTRDAAASRGIEVHRYAEALITGRSADVPEELVPYVESAVSFMDQWKVRPVLSEVVVASRRWQYAGTLDLIADLPDGRRILFDYKTTRSGIYPETALQLAAYRHADCYLGTDGETEMPMSEIGIHDAKAVWVRPDGYDVVPLDTSETVFKIFVHLLFVANATRDMKSWVGAPEYAA